MTLRELFTTNSCISELRIDVRDYRDGKAALIKAYHIGPGATEDRFPQSNGPRWKTICKKINSKDEGKDYWQTKTTNVPEELLDMEVDSWQLWEAYRTNNGLRKHYELNVNLIGMKDDVVAELPKEKEIPALEGQMNITDFI